MHFSRASLAAFATAIRAGRVAAAPAEGVYGYVADPFNPVALEKLLHLKQRNPSKGFIVLIRSPAQLSQLCPTLPTACTEAIATYWPKTEHQTLNTEHQFPTTLILPALPTLPELLTGNQGTVAVRCPHNVYMQEYLATANTPLVSTSLNLSGEPPATQASQIPSGITALTLPTPLSGTPSRIFAPLDATWLR